MPKLIATTEALQNAELESAAHVESEQFAAVKGEYHAHKIAKRVLCARVTALAALPKDVPTIKLLEQTKTQLVEVQKKAAGLHTRFQSLYCITYDASHRLRCQHLCYLNDSDHPGDLASNLFCAATFYLPSTALH